MEDWLRLFRSRNPTVRFRAAQGLLSRGDSVPLPVLLEILDELHDQGLGAATKRVLRTRRDPELLDEMIRRLRSTRQFIREVACEILGRLGNRSATPHLLAALDDPAEMVRRAAGWGLADLGDPACGLAVLQHYENEAEYINVRWALEAALASAGVEFRRRLL